MPIRRKNTIVAVRVETTPGVDAIAGGAAVGPSDLLRADCTIAFNQQQITNPEMNGSLDPSAPIPGGTRATITLAMVARGSGTPGTPARWGRLMRCCAFEEVIDAVGVADAAAQGGTGHTVQANASFSNTAQAYRGLPVILTGNPAGPAIDLIADYAADRTATLMHTYDPDLDNTTHAAIPAHVTYRPLAGLLSETTCTIYVYTDGIVWKFPGCAGAWDLDLATAGIGQLRFAMQGEFAGSEGVAVPGGLAFETTQPPVFRSGVSRIAQNLARISRFTCTSGGTVFNPENPEAPEGYDAGIITARNITGQIDPLMEVADTVARATLFKQGGNQPIAVQWGNVAGNRLAVVVPAAQYTGQTPGNRSELMAETLPFFASGPDAGLYLTVF